MRSRALDLGSSPCRAGGPPRRSTRIIIALAAAMCCLGWLSSVAVATVVCDEESTYCRDVGLRCTYSGQGQNCCAYTCAPDESCTAEEQQPLVECAPPEVYVHRNVYSGAPGCETALDGQTDVINQSDFYWYKFNASTTAESQIWSCPDCHETANDDDQQVKPTGQAGFHWHHSVSLPTTTSCNTCPTCITSGCCDNCPSDCQDSECDNKRCNSESPHTGQVCASVTSYVEFTAWSKNGTSWISYSSPKTVPVFHLTSACDP
jgi:hypothetical protein